MPVEKKKYLTSKEYLDYERNSSTKNEYYNGELYSFAGTSFKHSVICSNIHENLFPQLKNNTCKVLQSEMRVHIKEQDSFVYPDISVVCEQPKFLDNAFDTLLNPVVVFEVLSPSTELYDRGMKFSMYRKIESLKEYIIVAQDRICVEHYVKKENDSWSFNEYNSLEDSFTLPFIECKLDLKYIYYDIEFNDDPYVIKILREHTARYATQVPLG